MPNIASIINRIKKGKLTKKVMRNYHAIVIQNWNALLIAVARVNALYTKLMYK